MKKYIYLSVILLFVCTIKAQDFGSWILPDATDVYRVNFYPDNLVVEWISPYSYPSDVINSDGGYGNDGDLHFYILDKYLYSNSNQLINTYIKIESENVSPEVEIIKIPGGLENLYYIIWSSYDLNKDDQGYIGYTEVEYNTNNNNVSINYPIGFFGVTENGYTGFALTEEENNMRYMYYSNELTGLCKTEVTSVGIGLNIDIIVDRFDTYFQSPSNFLALNLEIKETNDNETVIAWITTYNNGFEKIFVVTIDNNNNITKKIIDPEPDLGRITGIEFSPVEDNILFFSCEGGQEGTYRLNINDESVEPVFGSADYQKTFIQLAANGYIYAVSNNGDNLGQYDPVSGVFQSNVQPLGVETFYLVDGIEHYVLPENSRLFSILSLDVNISYVSCPGYEDGSAIATVTGGTEPYYYRWYNSDNVIILEGQGEDYSHIENLAEGQYTCCVIDDTDEEVCEIFYIILDPDLFSYDEWWEVTENTSGNNLTESFKEGIWISDNAVLTLTDCYFEFGKDAKVIIEPRSKLIVDNSTLTHLIQCIDKWHGIEVWGDKTQHQFTINGQCAQGKLVLQNNSVIANAEVGVALWGEQNHEWLKSGGIAQSNNTNFINNTKAVHFVPYQNTHPVTGDPMLNLSHFKLDTFDINIYYVDHSTFYKHADVHGVNGIDFEGCAFTNTATSGVSTFNLGIAAYGGGFKVMTGCSDNVVPCPPQNIRRCTFNGFYQAIGAYSSLEYIHTFMVDDALFQNNITGVYVSGVNNAVIINSDFHVGYTQPTDAYYDCDAVPFGYGIDIHSSIGFAVEDNYFTKYAGAQDGHYYGIRVYECPSYSDDIYRNEFVGLSVGNQAEGENRSIPINDRTGVAYLCNQNTNNDYDFYVAYESTIRGNMGDDVIPSGNTLTDPDISVVQFQNDFTQDIRYYYNISELDEWLVEYSDYVFAYPVNAENTCPPHYGGGGGHVELTAGERQQKEQDYAQNISDYNGVKALFDNLKDGGNTDAELLDIQTAQPDDMWALRAQLLGDSPHLSREVLMETADKTDVFPESAIFDIMAANPDELRKDTLISYLENKSEPLPAYMIETLRQLADGSTYKTVLLNQMSTYHSGKVKAAQDIIRSILSDSITNLNDLRNWLDNIGGLEADKQIISTYLQEGDTTNTLTLLNMLPALYDLQDEELDAYYDYSDMINLQITLQSQNRNIHQLDSTEIAGLLWMADSASGDARVQARNILEYAYGYHYCDCPALPDSIGLKSSSNLNYGNLIKAKGMEIVATPNPASTWVAFDYHLALTYTEGTITISDVSGRVIEALKVTGNQGQKVWDIRRIKQGVYIYTLNAGGLSKSAKLIIK